MNIFNLILISLIFTSLIIIIVIFGRSLKRVKDINVFEEGSKQHKKKKNFIFRFFGWIAESIKRILVLIAEWFVKKVKKILHLVHFWLIKIRKGKKENGLADDIEAKKELIIEEEKNLDLVINDELAESDVEMPESEGFQKIELKQEREILIKAEESLEAKKDVFENEDDQIKKKTSKISQFFSRKGTEKKEKLDDSPDISEENGLSNQDHQDSIKVIIDEEAEDISEEKPEKEKVGFLGKIKSAFSNKKAGDKSDSGMQEGFSEFSDGVMKVERQEKQPNEENLIKEVVRTGSIKNGLDQDDELGVDRSILEKKILKKVEKDPRNMENYRQLGDLYIKMKNFEDAENAYKFIIKISPRDVDAKRKIEKIKLLKRLN
jgi:tetratricopeptide (TPR) repeat protein